MCKTCFTLTGSTDWASEAARLGSLCGTDRAGPYLGERDESGNACILRRFRVAATYCQADNASSCAADEVRPRRCCACGSGAAGPSLASCA